MRCLLFWGCQHKINTPLIYQVQDKTTRWFINSRKPITHENPTTPEDITASTYKLKNSSTHKLTTQTTPDTSSSTYKPINSQTQKETPPHQLVSSQTHKLKTHHLTSPSTQKVKIITFVLQNCFNFRPVLAKI